MRASPRRLLPLPPVPPRDTWSRTFPLANFNVVNRLTGNGHGGAVSKGGKRTQIADQALANSIARKLGISKDQVILEAYPGMGFLTRAMLALPQDQRPRKVLTVEPSIDFNVRGLCLTLDKALAGMSSVDDNVKAKQQLMAERRDAARQVLTGLASKGKSSTEVAPTAAAAPPTVAMNEANGTPVFRAFPSEDDSALTIIDGTMFDWKTVPALEEQGLLDDVQRREWQDGERFPTPEHFHIPTRCFAEPPNLHFVAHIPDQDMGEQLVNQWISCVAGPSWLFRLGRVRMSLLVKPSLYDVGASQRPPVPRD